MPERVDRKDQIPHGQRQEVDEHPAHIDDLARGDEDEDGGKAEFPW